MKRQKLIDSMTSSDMASEILFLRRQVKEAEIALKESFSLSWQTPEDHGFESDLLYWIHQASLTDLEGHVMPCAICKHMYWKNEESFCLLPSCKFEKDIDC